MRNVPRLVLALALLVGASALSGCHPSSNVQRCDDLLDRQEELVANMGGWFRCDPSYDPDEQAHCPPSYRCTIVMEWDKRTPDGERQPWAWEWQANLDDYWLQVDAWQLVCETYDYRAGLIPSYYLDVQRDAVPASVEQSCFQWATAQP